ncbi:MAG: diguanylate cyclase [Campylobacterota bacterium]|nr:diguanylate cyclase [Campylobacterota bacterium]
MKMSFKLKLFSAFVAFGFSLVIITQLIVFKINELSIKSASIKKASELFVVKDNMFNSYIRDTKLILTSIKSSKIFTSYISSNTSLQQTESFFLDIANTSDNIMQLRYIDNDGQEIIRVDRDEFGSSAYVVSPQMLQNKSSRYYFKEILSISDKEFWYSKIDLNMEYGKIEKPYKPVIRIGVPIFNNGERKGVLLINIFMKTFLKRLSSAPLFDIYLFDKDGYILVDSVHEHCWNKYIKHSYQDFDKELKQSIEIIFSSKEYYGDDFYAKRISLNNGEELHMVIRPKSDYIQQELKKNLYQLGWIMILVLLFSIPFSFFFAKTPIKLKEKVDIQKREQDILLSLFDLSDAVLFKWNNDESWSVSSVSQSVNKLLGYTQHEFQNNSIQYSACIYHDDLKQVMAEVVEAVEKNLYFFEHKPYRIHTKSGEIKWILDSTVIVRDENNEVINFIGYLTDITELKNNEIELIRISRTDQLTKISNRMSIDEILKNQYYRFCRDGEPCSVILIDIDYFKSVNDDHGHMIGDKVLIEFATLLKSLIREGDVVGRWGGEEFLIILPHTSLSKAILLANKLREKISEFEFSVVKHKTASFGVSTFDDGVSVEILIDNADKALYKSKENGRNLVSTL